MKFFLDANLPNLLVGLIHQEFGIQATRINGPLTDAEVFEIIKQKKSVLLTLDTDFQNILQYPPKEHYGIVVFRLKNQNIKRIAATVLNFFSARQTHEILKDLKGKIVVFREDRYKVHSQIN